MLIFMILLMLVMTVESSDLSVDPKCGESAQPFNREDFVLPWHRLIGGIETAPNAWPWTVELSFKGKHHCGGALISSELVLTAAHCFGRSRIPSSYLVHVGGHKLLSGDLHKVTKILTHPYYHFIRNSAYDAALVRIKPPVNMTEFSTTPASTICMPSALPPTGQMCIVTGWGYESESGKRTGNLREIHVPILPAVTCNDFWHYNGRIHLPTMFCAGYSMGKIDSCQGDSGGPLFCYNQLKSVWELHGLVSWGIGCAKPGFPGVYTKVFALLPWINASVKHLLL